MQVAVLFQINSGSFVSARVTSLSYHYQSNSQVEACIKFIKHTMKKCIETSDDIHIALFFVTDKSNSINVWAARSSYAVIQPSNMRYYANNKEDSN